MALICHPKSRIDSIGNFRDMMQRNAPSDSMIEAAKQWTEKCDPYSNYLIECYLDLEKQRHDFLSVAGPIFEGIGLLLGSISANLNYSNESTRVLADHEVQSAVESANEVEVQAPQVIHSRDSIKKLSFEVVAPKFLCPIEQAACELKVSEATLSLWCRMEKISYWPYRKLKSIENLIQIFKEIGVEEHEDRKEVDNAIKMLEEEKNSIMQNPNLPLKNSIVEMRKRMRNKADYIRKRKRTTKGNKKIDDIHYLFGRELRGKKDGLSFELVSTKFHLSIEKAAEELHVNRKTLRKWCLSHGISLWPYRKIKKKSRNA